MDVDHGELRDLLLLLLQALEEEEAGAGSGTLAALARERDLEGADVAGLFAWLEQRWPGGVPADDDVATPCLRPGAGTCRPQGELEREVLSVPAFGYLVDLVRTQQISAEQMETLIQIAHRLAGGPLDPADLAPLLDHVVFARGRPGPAWRALDAGELPH